MEKGFLDPNGIYYRGGLGCFAWFIFEKKEVDYCKTYWIDNSMYLLGSKSCPYRLKNGEIIKKKVKKLSRILIKENKS